MPPACTPPPNRINFFHFHIRFHQKVYASEVGTPSMGQQPPNGKSWIHYCVTQKQVLELCITVIEHKTLYSLRIPHTAFPDATKATTKATTTKREVHATEVRGIRTSHFQQKNLNSSDDTDRNKQEKLITRLHYIRSPMDSATWSKHLNSLISPIFRILHRTNHIRTNYLLFSFNKNVSLTFKRYMLWRLSYGSALIRIPVQVFELTDIVIQFKPVSTDE